MLGFLGTSRQLQELAYPNSYRSVRGSRTRSETVQSSMTHMKTLPLKYPTPKRWQDLIQSTFCILSLERGSLKIEISR